MVNVMLAHAGHGITEGNSFAHYFSEPLHLMTFVVGCSALMAVAWYVRRAKRLQQERV